MSSLTIILIVVAVIAMILGPLFMLDGNGKFNIPKDFKNKQGYDQDEEDDDWPDSRSEKQADSQKDKKTGAKP